ncbi:hypothetical protein ACFWE3_02085 [Mycobacteriaceae bacterium NPDC060252]
MIEPISSFSTFESMAKSLVGRKLMSVRYTAGDTGGQDRGEKPPEFENDYATELFADLELYFEHDIRLALQWAMHEFDFGLSLISEPSNPRIGQNIGIYTPWAKALGSKLASIRSSWLDSTDKSKKMLWSLTFEFDSAMSVTVALGQIDPMNGRLRLVPDGLVLIFNPEHAKAYIPVSTGSAYGD